ncbi:hypothetical protein COU76_04360 [Candidatus Peregrinibacteria bacterium CG10_big_fil_rev_8_21_14_0_10_49_10]|nr:MAG: hypothetical protein COU76_04360 [Candidatus Peregrinibacteria bacterium CG10_big_fil_rev_8_21_14_0_10_49_10]
MQVSFTLIATGLGGITAIWAIFTKAGLDDSGEAGGNLLVLVLAIPLAILLGLALVFVVPMLLAVAGVVLGVVAIGALLYGLWRVLSSDELEPVFRGFSAFVRQMFVRLGRLLRSLLRETARFVKSLLQKSAQFISKTLRSVRKAFRKKVTDTNAKKDERAAERQSSSSSRSNSQQNASLLRLTALHHAFSFRTRRKQDRDIIRTQTIRNQRKQSAGNETKSRHTRMFSFALLLLRRRKQKEEQSDRNTTQMQKEGSVASSHSGVQASQTVSTQFGSPAAHTHTDERSFCMASSEKTSENNRLPVQENSSKQSVATHPSLQKISGEEVLDREEASAQEPESSRRGVLPDAPEAHREDTPTAGAGRLAEESQAHVRHTAMPKEVNQYAPTYQAKRHTKTHGAREIAVRREANPLYTVQTSSGSSSVEQSARSSVPATPIVRNAFFFERGNIADFLSFALVQNMQRTRLAKQRLVA